MGKDEKFEPRDSVRDRKDDGQVVKRAADKRYRQEEADLADPAKRRKYSEQPPTQRNAKP